jgi:DNA-binding MarR family transcriptional regulator
VDLILAAWERELPAALSETSELSKRILELSGILRAALANALTGFDLSMAEYDILIALRRVGDPHRLTPSELASDLILSTGGVTKALHALTDRKLVRRHPDPSDARRRLVQLTASGRRLADHAVLASTSAQHDVFAGASADVTGAATSALRQLTHALHSS